MLILLIIAVLSTSANDSSKSKRINCWWRLNTRNFVIVGALATVTKSVSTCTECRLSLIDCAASSSPTKPTIFDFAPNAAIFSATFAAPPGRSSICLTLTIGTGASGEIRAAGPCQYLSSMTSPTTNTFACSYSGKVIFILSLSRAFIGLDYHRPY